MNTIMRLRRLREPRSNLATNLLFAITFAAFALIGNTAIQQQHHGMAGTSHGAEMRSAEVQEAATAATSELPVRAMLRRLLF